MLRNRVDEELLIQAQVSAAELTRERDSLKESNTLLAQKLSKVQDALSRVRREKEVRERELTEANTQLFEQVRARVEKIQALEKSCNTLVGNVTKLENILEEARKERTQRDEEHHALLHKYLALQVALEQEREQHTALKHLCRQPDHLDSVCEHDKSLATASEALRFLETLTLSVKRALAESEVQTKDLINSLESHTIDNQHAFEGFLRVDEEIIAHLEGSLRECSTSFERNVTTLLQRARTAEAALAKSRRTLERAQVQLRGKDAAILELRTSLLAARSACLAEEPAVNLLKAELMQATNQLKEERRTWRTEKKEIQKRLQHSLETEKRLAANVQRLEVAVREGQALTKVLAQHRRESVQDTRRVEEELTRQHAAGLAKISKDVAKLGGIVHSAVNRLTHSIEEARQKSAGSAAAGLSSVSTSSGSASDAPWPRTPSASSSFFH